MTDFGAWSPPSAWDEFGASLDNSALSRTPMAGMGRYAGEQMGGYMKGSGGAGTLYHTSHKNPAASSPYVNTASTRRDGADVLSDPTVPLIDAKSQGTPTRHEVASSPLLGPPDYSQVYSLDEEIKRVEREGPGIVDMIGKGILGEDFHGRRLAGLYRTRELARHDADSRYAASVLASRDPEAFDTTKHVSQVVDAEGNVWMTGFSNSGKVKHERVGHVAAKEQTKDHMYTSPVEEEGTGFAVVGTKPSGEAIYATKKTTVPIEGPQTQEAISNTEEGSAQAPVLSTSEEKVRLRKEPKQESQADRDRSELAKERLEGQRRENAEKARAAAEKSEMALRKGKTPLGTLTAEDDEAIRAKGQAAYDRIMGVKTTAEPDAPVAAENRKRVRMRGGKPVEEKK